MKGASGMVLNVVNGGHNCLKANRKALSSGVEGARMKGERCKAER